MNQMQKEIDSLTEANERLIRELADARQETMMWVREVTGRDCDIERLTRELAEALAGSDRWKQWSDDKGRTLQEALGIAVADRDRLRTLLENIAKEIRRLDEEAYDEINMTWALEWVGQIDAALKEQP